MRINIGLSPAIFSLKALVETNKPTQASVAAALLLLFLTPTTTKFLGLWL